MDQNEPLPRERSSFRKPEKIGNYSKRQGNERKQSVAKGMGTPENAGFTASHSDRRVELDSKMLLTSGTNFVQF